MSTVRRQARLWRGGRCGRDVAVVNIYFRNSDLAIDPIDECDCRASAPCELPDNIGSRATTNDRYAIINCQNWCMRRLIQVLQNSDRH
jgi:hypothetical protein